jgi:hypothetical protein
MTDQSDETLHQGWQLVYQSNQNEATERMRVPGGWLYRDSVTTFLAGDKDINVVFVPD